MLGATWPSGAGDHRVVLEDPRRVDLGRRDQARGEQLDLGVEDQELVLPDVVIGPLGLVRPLVALALVDELVLAEDDVPFEVEFEGVGGVVDELAVDVEPGRALLALGPPPDDDVVGLDVDDPLLLGRVWMLTPLRMTGSACRRAGVGSDSNWISPRPRG